MVDVRPEAVFIEQGTEAALDNSVDIESIKTSLAEIKGNTDNLGDTVKAALGEVLKAGHLSSASHTRPDNITAYIIGDVIGTDAATNMIFENVSSILGGNIIITSGSIRIDAAAIPRGMSILRLHLYNAAPTAIVDNAAYNLPVGDRTKYIGYIDFTTLADNGDTIFSQVENVNMQRQLATGSTSLYGILETRGAFTPTASTVKTITLNTIEV